MSSPNIEKEERRKEREREIEKRGAQQVRQSFSLPIMVEEWDGIREGCSPPEYQ